jgi:hypothetical protein
MNDSQFLLMPVSTSINLGVSYIPFFYLLDRNDVSLIKDSVAGDKSFDIGKQEFLKYLRGIDNPEDYVSPILSIMEGEHGREDTPIEKENCLSKEVNAVRAFFGFAKTDSIFLSEASQIFCAVFTQYREGGWISREFYLENAVSFIKNIVSKADRKSIEEKLLSLSEKAKLSPFDPVVVLCLACLYGSNPARRLIKPNKLNSYNTLSDLHTISRVAMIRAVAQGCNSPLRVRLVTRDQGLNDVLEQVRISRCRVDSDGNLQTEIKYLPGLFPELSIHDYRSLLRKLREG